MLSFDAAAISPEVMPLVGGRIFGVCITENFGPK